MTSLVPILKALADESRLRILNLLFVSGELCVCDIESTLGFTQTKVSRHMRYLKRAGVVADRRKGKWILYSIAPSTTHEHKAMLMNIRKLIADHLQPQRDSQRLFRSIQNNCCATYTEVLPHANIPKNK